MQETFAVLGEYTGDPSVDAFYGAVLDSALDPTVLEQARLRRHVFLARFARQNLLQWADVEGRLVRTYVSMLAEFLNEEGEAVKAAARSGSAEV